MPRVPPSRTTPSATYHLRRGRPWGVVPQGRAPGSRALDVRDVAHAPPQGLPAGAPPVVLAPPAAEGTRQGAPGALPLAPELILSILSHLQAGPARQVAQDMVQWERAHPELRRLANAEGPQSRLMHRLYAQQGAVSQLWRQAEQSGSLQQLWPVAPYLSEQQQRVLLQGNLLRWPGEARRALFERSEHMPIQQLAYESLLLGGKLSGLGLEGDGSWLMRLNAAQREAVLGVADLDGATAFELLNAPRDVLWTEAECERLFRSAQPRTGLPNVAGGQARSGDYMVTRSRRYLLTATAGEDGTGGPFLARIGAARQLELVGQIFTHPEGNVWAILRGVVPHMRHLAQEAQKALVQHLKATFDAPATATTIKQVIVDVTASSLSQLPPESFADLSPLVLRWADETTGWDRDLKFCALIHSWARLQPEQKQQCADHVLRHAVGYDDACWDRYERMDVQRADMASSHPRAAAVLQQALQERSSAAATAADAVFRSFDAAQDTSVTALGTLVRALQNALPSTWDQQTYAAVFARIAAVENGDGGGGGRLVAQILTEATSVGIDAALLSLCEVPDLIRQAVVLDAVTQRMVQYVGDAALERLALIVLTTWTELPGTMAAANPGAYSGAPVPIQSVSRAVHRLLARHTQLTDDVRDRLVRGSLAADPPLDDEKFPGLVALMAPARLP